VNAGSDASGHTVSTAFNRTATEVDNGAAITARAWTVVSGPAQVGATIGTTAALAWTPGTVGTYVLRYAATNSVGTTADPMTLGVAVAPAAPTGSDPVFATLSQIATLSITSPAAMRAKAIADGVRNGTYIGGGSGTASDWHYVNAFLGSIALCTALWWRRTGDNSYLGPLKTYILSCPKLPPSQAGRALDPMRQAGGLFMASDIVKKAGQWDNNATLPNHGGDTWTEFVHGGGSAALRFEIRRLNTVDSRWSHVRTVPASQSSTIDDSASNWGAVARFSHLGWAVAANDTAAIAYAVGRMKKFLGDQSTGQVNFNKTSSYIQSWNNWGTTVVAGVGKTDPANPGLDGVIIDDICRGGTGYNPSAAYYGATASGLSYPLENTDYVWAVAACLMNLGHPVRSWGEGGNAFDRMNARLARIRPGDTQSLFDYTEAKAGVYKGGRFIASRLSGNANYGTGAPTSSGPSGMSRAMPFGDWLTEGTTWGQSSGSVPPPVGATYSDTFPNTY